MSVRALRSRSVVGASVLLIGAVFLSGTSAQSLGGLYNGRPASSPRFDLSGQYGPGIIDGTNRADVIIGTDGDDHLDGNGGDDWVCGGHGDDVIFGGRGDDFIDGEGGYDHLDGGPGRDTVFGGTDFGNDTIIGGPGQDVLVGGNGDDVMISNDDSGKQGIDDVDAGDDFDVCHSGGGDLLTGCEF